MQSGPAELLCHLFSQALLLVKILCDPDVSYVQ